ncbi:hypothetical protein ACHQM5_021187 [Ranunculus cassubicifolius]
MGNCLVLENKFVKVMKIDGKVLGYQTPLKVHQVLSDCIRHAISDTLPVQIPLSPDSSMRSGHLYYLLPPPLRSKDVKSTKKEPTQGTGLVRVKIVITKQDLKDMLAKGVLSVDEIVSRLQNKESSDSISNRNCSGWKPDLHSIPE